MRWGVFAAALLVRLGIAFVFFGSVDVTNNMKDASMLLAGLPASDLRIPHLPGVHLLIWAAGVLAFQTELPVSFVFKFSGCMYDSAIAALLFSGRGKRAGWLYALAPVPILIFAIHGQWDSLALAILLGSLLLLRREGRGPAALAGALFVLAAIAKPIAIPFAPLFLERKRLVPILGGMAACFLVWLTALWLIGDPLSLATVDHVFRYARGGVTYFGAPFALGVTQNRLLVLLPMLALLPLYAMGRLRREDAILLFYGFALATCGLSVQYLSWLVPFLLLRGYDRFAALYSLAAGVFLVTFYVSPFGGVGGYNFENLGAFAPLRNLAWLCPNLTNARLRLDVLRTIGDIVIPLLCLGFLVFWVVRRSRAGEPEAVSANPAAPVWVALAGTAVMVAVALFLPRPDADMFPGRIEAKFGQYLLESYRPPVKGLERAMVIPLDPPPSPVRATSVAWVWIALWCAAAGLPGIGAHLTAKRTDR